MGENKRLACECLWKDDFAGMFALGGTHCSAHYMWCDVPEGYSSGQRGQTVNLLAMPSEVRILPPPPLCQEVELTKVIRACEALCHSGRV